MGREKESRRVALQCHSLTLTLVRCHTLTLLLPLLSPCLSAHPTPDQPSIPNRRGT
jgi:hypothetical protein